LFLVCEYRGLGIRVSFFTPDLRTAYSYIDLPGDWHDGPGIVSRPNRHAVAREQCGVIPIEIFRAVGGEDPSTSTRRSSVSD
jgi:hypothetical protein